MLVSLLVALPAFAVIWHRDGGEVLFVLYRQPKLAAVAMLGWLFLASFVWYFLWLRRPLTTAGHAIGWSDLRRLMTRPACLWLVAFVAYMASTGLWVRVGANYRYELRQWVLLLLLVTCLSLWLAQHRAARRAVLLSLLLSLALISLVGLVQLAIPLPWLSPINPQIGAVNPSFMGYKNPMALALLGQLFLVVQQTMVGPWRPFWRLVLGMELVYLATLGSRTSYFALAVATAYWLVLRGSQASSQKRRGRAGSLTWTIAAIGIFGAVLAWHPVARQKAASVLAFVASPSHYLQSDRGIYLRNTLNMVAHRPWGVGLGDWQTHYPVYRLHGREVAFDDRFQVRRAHSDWVQVLGEGGWPGALLWTAFAIALMGAPHRSARRGSLGDACFAAQWLALFVAMGSDYLLELPYNKFQFFVLLALHWGQGSTATVSDLPAPGVGQAATSALGGQNRWLRGCLLAAVMLTMVASLHHYSQLLRRTFGAAAIAQAYGRWSAGDAGAWPDVLRQLVRHERAVVFGAGETKTLHKDYLQLAHLAQLTGRPQATVYAAWSLRHHPYYAPAFRLMAELVADPRVSDQWQQGSTFLMHHATAGWQGVYPPLPPGPSP